MSGPRPVVRRVGSVPARVLAIAAGAGLATAMPASGASALTVPSVPVGSVSVPSVSVPSVPSLPSVPLPVPSVSAPKLPVPSVSVPSVPALPLPSVSAPKLPVPSGSVPPVSVPSLPVPVSTAPVPGAPSVPGLPSAPGLPSVPGVPAPVGSVLSGVQSGVQSGVGQLSGGLSGITGGTTGSLLNLGVNASPIGTACVQARGTGGAIANVTVTVAGHNITAPLVQALPGVLAPCPAGATPGSPGVGASAGGGLVGACVQATSKAPFNASILVLDTELVGTLTKAGVPLQQVIVPCPKGITGGQPGTGGTGGTGASAGSSGVGGASGAGAAAGLGAAGGSSAGSAAAGGKGPGGSGAGCANGSGGWSSLNAQTLSSVIPSNVPQTLPWILLALALLGRRRLGQAVAKMRALRGFRRVRLEA